jgi:cytochrome P450
MAGRDKIDVVDDFAYPFPVTVICDLLGVPAEDEVQFHGWATAITDSFDLAFESDAAEVERRAALTAQARIELGQYLAALVGKYSQAPVDNFMSGLVTDDGPEGRMSQGDTLATAVMLLIAGHETTVNLITNGVLTLLRHQDVLERLGREPELMIGTVEELLRYEPPQRPDGHCDRRNDHTQRLGAYAGSCRRQPRPKPFQ